MQSFPTTENPAWGFYGTIAQLCSEPASAAFEVAIETIHDATGEDPEDIRTFLDSRHGRHFADEVANNLGAGLVVAIEEAVAKWMAWRITERTSRQYDIPVGLPYLTSFITLEAAAAA